MGIPLYFLTITKTYSGILHTSRPQKPAWYFFDYNGAIHHAAQTVLTARKGAVVEAAEVEQFERDIYEEVWRYTQECIGKADPSSHVGIYIDGVAPVAKINQQRKRRYMSVLRHELLGTSSVWDTNAISPGTPFMIRLQAFLRKQVAQDSRAVQYTLSGADEPGEGEHKIFANIATIPAGECIFIHGLDADLIMLSLMSHHPNIVLMREPTWPYHAENTAEGFIYLDIDRFRQGLLQHLKDTYKWNIPDTALSDIYSQEARGIVETYVVLCFLLGNDFLPHAPSLSLKKGGYEDVLRAAKDAFETYPFGAVAESRVFVPFLTHVLTTLSKQEDNKLFKVNEDYIRKHPSPQADAADAYPLKAENKDVLAKLIQTSSQQKRWRPLYYKHLFFTRMNDTSIIAQACEQYVKGVCWTYAYYKRMPKPWDWYYPYGYPPTLLDISNYLQGTPVSTWDEMQTTWQNTHRSPTFLEPTVQLLCILPRASEHLIPFKYREWMTNHRYGIAWMFPTKYPIQTYLHTHLWECAPVLPPLDIQWILHCMEST